MRDEEGRTVGFSRCENMANKWAREQGVMSRIDKVDKLTSYMTQADISTYRPFEYCYAKIEEVDEIDLGFWQL